MAKVFREWPRSGRAARAWLTILSLVPGAAHAAMPSEPPPRGLDPSLLASRPQLIIVQAPTQPAEAVETRPANTRQPAPLDPVSRPPQAAPPVRDVEAGELSQQHMTERWVIDQLARKQIADLSQAPGGQWLHGSFVAGLIDGSAHPTVPFTSVRLSHGEVRGDVLVEQPQASLVAFEGVRFNAGFSAKNARFPGSLWLAHGTRLGGPLALDSASVGGDLELEESTFVQRASLAGLTTSGAVFLDRADFLDGLDLRSASIGATVQAYDTAFRCTTSCDYLPSLNLSGARISRDLLLGDISVVGNTQADYLGINGSLQLSRPSFGGVADFTSGTVGFLALSMPQLPKNLSISQMRYGSISNGQRPYNAANSWKDLKQLLASGDTPGDIYAHLEQFFHDSGYAGIADEVYVESRVQERKNLPWVAYFLNVLSDYTIGYGRHPVRAFLFMAMFVLTGVVVFANVKEMEDTEPDKPGPSYNAFWYSLDLFVPIARLQAADRWIPKRQRRLAWVYLRLHVLLGWVLVPLGLAAVSGLVH